MVRRIPGRATEAPALQRATGEIAFNDGAQKVRGG
jgi:hypothetical protein